MILHPNSHVKSPQSKQAAKWLTTNKIHCILNRNVQMNYWNLRSTRGNKWNDLAQRAKIKKLKTKKRQQRNEEKKRVNTGCIWCTLAPILNSARYTRTHCKSSILIKTKTVHIFILRFIQITFIIICVCVCAWPTKCYASYA